MALILCIETSTKVCSVCVALDGKVLKCVEDLSADYSHAEKLNVLIDEVLEKAKKRFRQLDAVAISEGPGSYTGLRIGVSAAKGIAFAMQIPIVAVSSLKAMCTSARDNSTDTLLLPMIDARRMEVFTAGYNGNLKEVFPTRAEVLVDASFPEKEAFEKVRFFGDGSEKAFEILRASGVRQLKNIYASAKGMAPLADRKFKKSDFVDTAYFEPFYLKDFVAGKPKKEI